MIGLRRKNDIFIAVAIILTSFILLILWSARKPLDDGVNAKNPKFSTGKCNPQNNLFFLKTHKCGSSTVQNVLMRRGLQYDLNYVLPAKDNYLGYPQLFTNFTIGEGLMDETEQFNILAHHCRFKAESVRTVMPKDTKKVAIVREPVALFDSLFYYYNMGQYWLKKEQQVSLSDFLANSEDEIEKLVFSKQRMGYRIGHNQMAFDFGFDPYYMKNQTVVTKFIEMLGKEFHLVMLTEFMEASMVLLADLMCWSLEEVAFIPLNVRANSTNLTPIERDKIEKINHIDVQIYKFFKKLFKSKVTAFGLEKMEKRISQLTELNNELLAKCVVLSRNKSHEQEFGDKSKLNYFMLRENAPPECNFVMKDELIFTELLRRRQRNKFSAKSKIDKLLQFSTVF